MLCRSISVIFIRRSEASSAVGTPAVSYLFTNKIDSSALQAVGSQRAGVTCHGFTASTVACPSFTAVVSSVPWCFLVASPVFLLACTHDATGAHQVICCQLCILGVVCDQSQVYMALPAIADCWTKLPRSFRVEFDDTSSPWCSSGFASPPSGLSARCHPMQDDFSNLAWSPRDTILEGLATQAGS